VDRAEAGRAAHLAQARGNLAVARRLLAAGPVDADPVNYYAHQWAAVAVFYCAVHLIDAQLLRHGARPRDHNQRDQLIVAGPAAVPEDVYRAYRFLYRRSREVRYEMAWLHPDYITSVLIGRFLATIATWAGAPLD
jgi:hypothetical protein